MRRCFAAPVDCSGPRLILAGAPRVLLLAQIAELLKTFAVGGEAGLAASILLMRAADAEEHMQVGLAGRQEGCSADLAAGPTWFAGMLYV
jgi:hypothetical protein